MPITTKSPFQTGIHLAAVRQLSKDRRRSRSNAPLRGVENWKIMPTLHEILVDWREIKNSSRESVRTGFNQIVALCEETGKDEFVIEDIAPGYIVGGGDPAIVLDAQERIVSIFMQVAATCFHKLPEHRLSLRRGIFDLRFYLGDTRPTDFVGPDEEY